MFNFILGLGLGCYVTSIYYENGKNVKRTKDCILNKFGFSNSEEN